ncbi:GIY-YIG nuclease family protein [Candidatus Peregrinibacteria bacterium]|nr:GIY-YIG nuclease family protein [Candidatus Peregrinibacteria bacterium]
MNYYVYVLKSEINGYRYIGQTKKLRRRISEHNQGFTKSIQFQRPFKLEYYEVFETRSEAMKRERFLKSGKGREWFNNNLSGCGAVG